jgi:hypothetical protein
MSDLDNDVLGKYPRHAGTGKQSLVMRVTDSDFQSEVLVRLSRLETKMDMLTGNVQPGRMKQAEDRIMALERNDIRRSVYDRIVNAAISMAVSLAIALHGHLGLK